jgi:uncharacterized protein (TIGR02231 family)
MKTISIIILVFLSLWVNATDKKVKSKIEEVTVFQNGAQIHRKAYTNLKAGHQVIIFSDLSTAINASSIQVNGKGDFTIMSVTNQINYLKEINKNKRIASITDSISSLNKKVKSQQMIQSAYQQEIKLLEANRSLKGNNSNLSVSEIKLAAEYYRQRFRQIYKDQQLIDDKITNYQNEINKLNSTLNQLRQRRNPKGVGEIMVEIDSKKAISASFTFDYLVNNAGWTPLYDIRAIDANKDIELHYRANIYQNTGVDWNNVKLSVSTGNPHQNGVIPLMNVWYLSYSTARYKGKISNSLQVYKDEEQSNQPATAEYIKYNNTRASNSANYTTVTQGQTNTSFKISLPYTIPSSNKKVNVKVQKWTLPATYRYYAVPRLDQDAFLQARITGWEDLSLLPGAVNVFFEGTYVGKSYINPANLQDTMDISLGKDKNIVIERKKSKDKSANGIFGGDKKMNMGWNISVRNNKSSSIHIVIEDQIPLSNRADVEVKLIEKSGATYNEKNGFLRWDFNLNSKKSKKVDFQYQIKYPKDLNIYNMW